MSLVGADPVAADLSFAGVGRQPLNPPDRLMLVAHNALRQLGGAGFLCQSHLWTRSRIDPQRLFNALARLAVRHPVVNSRLAEGQRRHGPAWTFRPGDSCILNQDVVTDAGSAAVLRRAEGLFERPTDLRAIAPIDFHLWHLPDGRDVFVIRWCHALMDGKSPELLVRELDRLSEAGHDETTDHEPLNRDSVTAFLDRASRLRRLRAAAGVVAGQIRLPTRSVTLTPPDAARWVLDAPRIAVRTLDETRTERLLARVKRVCGFANLAPAILASAFRVTSRMSSHRQRRRTVFKTDVPLNLRPPGATGPIFRNFMSFISISASFDELGNRDDLTRRLSARMRDQLRRRIDLGNLQMMTLMSRWSAALTEHVKDRMKRKPLTFGFGFLGPATIGPMRFCGADIDNFYTLNWALSPPGMTLQVNQCGPRMNICLTYVERVIGKQTADEFLDGMLRDLLA